MKTVATVFFLLILFQATFSQTIDKLDEKNGFKTIKLGENKTKYSGSISYLKSVPISKTTIYKYTGSDKDLFKLFDIEITTVKLIFDDNTGNLVAISLLKQYSHDDPQHYSKASNDLKAVNNNFSILFGSYTSVINDEGDLFRSTGVEWRGKKVVMQSVTLYYGFYKDSGLEVTIMSKEFLQQDLEKGF